MSKIQPETIHDTLLLAQDTIYIETPVPYIVTKDSIIYVSNPIDTLAILKMFVDKENEDHVHSEEESNESGPTS